MDSASRPSRLERYTGYLLRRAHVRAERAASNAVPPPYAMRHLSVLALLHRHGPMSQRVLAGLTQVNRTTMVQLIDALEDDGLLRRERDANDRRSYALALTPEGEATLRGLTPAIDRAEQLLTANLSASQRTRLADLLSGLVDAGIVAKDTRCGYLIAHAHHTLRGEGTARLAPFGLDPRHLAALESIDRLGAPPGCGGEPCSQELVANDLAVSAPVVVDLVDDLVAAGFVQRRRNSDDRRRYDLTVTELGGTRLRAGLSVLGDIDGELRARLPPGGADELRRLLTALIDTPLPAACSPCPR